jgi:hypothetical protein
MGYGEMANASFKPSQVDFVAPTINPIATAGCSWEAKQVLGEAKIYEDGSAAFKVPARVPVYFEVLDSNGCMIAGMRSWSTLMPGESFPCVGCHENRKNAPPPGGGMANAAGLQSLDKPLGIEGKPFSYPEMVEPIIQKHCASCHTTGHKSGFVFTSGTSSFYNKKFTNSYLSLTKGLKGSYSATVGVTASNKAVCITSIFSQPEQMPPYSYGSTQSGMIKALLKGHNDVKLTAKELKILACWIDLECPHSGTYDSDLSDDADKTTYKKLEQTAQKWYDIEAKNCAEWANVQQVSAMPDNFDNFNTVKAGTVTKRFNIGYLPTERALVIANASQGNLILVDLKGTVVSRINLTDMNASGNVTITLSSALSTGVTLQNLQVLMALNRLK